VTRSIAIAVKTSDETVFLTLAFEFSSSVFAAIDLESSSGVVSGWAPHPASPNKTTVPKMERTMDRNFIRPITP
jgi:hypothetical protein